MSAELYQIYYNQETFSKLEPTLIPYDNSKAGVPPKWFEYEIFYKYYQENKDYDWGEKIVGFFSWKLTRKTNFSGEKIHQSIKDNPGHDVYYFADNKAHGFVRPNCWHQGNYYHKNLLGITQLLFDASGIGINIDTLETNYPICAYCNYWAGNRKFWDKYILLTEKLYRYILAHPHIDNMLSERADRSINASYHPFIMERMFSTLLAIDPDIKKYVIDDFKY